MTQKKPDRGDYRLTWFVMLIQDVHERWFEVMTKNRWRRKMKVHLASV